MQKINSVSGVVIGAIAGCMLSATVAQATNYNITDVINQTGSFTTTVFHEATSNGGKSGTIVERADVPAATGFYDDVTKVINYSFGLQSGNNVSGVGTLDFTVADEASLGFITTTFDIAPLSGSSQTIFNIEYFKHTYVGDANSFNVLAGGLAFLTLWGAEGTPTSNGNFDINTTTLGSDLRFALLEGPPQTVGEVPLPAALPLFGTGLAIMGFVGWRRKRKSAA